MQIPSSPALKGIIRHFLFLESRTDGLKQFRLFPNGSTGMVFSSAGELFFNRRVPGNAAEYLPDAFIYGQLSRYKDVACTGDISLFIVVFQPHAIHTVFGIPAIELKDRVVGIEDLIGHAAAGLKSRINERGSFREKIELIESFFLGFMREQTILENLLGKSIDVIWKHKGCISIAELNAIVGCEERKMERIFIQAVGLTPKQFTKLTKLQFFIKGMNDNTKMLNLAQLSCDAGYYDQAHLIHDFRKYTGMTPSHYHTVTRPLALNFLELSSVVGFLQYPER